jgi:hypothetical protein
LPYRERRIFQRDAVFNEAMLRAFAGCLVAALVWVASALAAPQLAQDESGDSAVLFDILAQSRPLQLTSSTSNGAFAPPTTLTRAPVAFNELQPGNLAIDDHGGAMATWTALGPAGRCPCAAYVSVRPPGGEFGPPKQLSEVGQSAYGPQVDVNPRGDAIVAWDGENPQVLTYSFRPAGGTFSAPAVVPGAISGDFTVVLQADGGALFIGTVPASGATPAEAYAVYRRPDGTFEQPVALDPVPPFAASAVAANRRGDVLIAWAKNGTVRARERPAGGSFGVPTVVASGSDIQEYPPMHALLNDAGDAAIAFAPSWLVTRSHGGAFGPRRLRPPQADTLAMDEGGNLAMAWVQPPRRLMAVYRPAGGAFGLPMLLGFAPFTNHGGLEPPLAPALALDGAGTATAVWEDSDGETVGIRSRRFSAAGPGAAADVATLPAYVQEASPEACVPAGKNVLAHSSRAVVVGNGSSDITGCLFARGIRVPLVSFPEEAQWPPRVVVAGPFSALAALSICHGCNGATWITITDLRDESSGMSRAGPALKGATPGGSLPVLRLKRDGSATWIACPPGKQGARGACKNGGKRIKQVYAFGLSRDVPKLVGQGAKIDPASLKIGTDRVRWRDRGHRRSAPLG